MRTLPPHRIIQTTVMRRPYPVREAHANTCTMNKIIWEVDVSRDPALLADAVEYGLSKLGYASIKPDRDGHSRNIRWNLLNHDYPPQ